MATNRKPMSISMSIPLSVIDSADKFGSAVKQRVVEALDTLAKDVMNDEIDKIMYGDPHYSQRPIGILSVTPENQRPCYDNHAQSAMSAATKNARDFGAVTS